MTLDEIYETISPNKPEPVVSSQHDTLSRALERVHNLFATKNEEYAGGADILGNFRRQAAQQNVPMSTAWMFLAGKHIDAIQEYVKDTRAGVKRNRTQDISERIDDLIVYALLLHVIAEEEK